MPTIKEKTNARLNFLIGLVLMIGGIMFYSTGDLSVSWLALIFCPTGGALVGYNIYQV